MARISSSGSHIVYQSRATNLVDNDLNNRFDVFRYTIETDSTERASETRNGDGGDDTSSHATISADGNVIAFASQSRNFVSFDIGFGSQIYRKEMDTGSIELVSGINNQQGKENSVISKVSIDGNSVFFESRSDNLLDGVQGSAIYRYRNSELELASRNNAGEAANDSVFLLDVSANGEELYFSSSASNLLTGSSSSTRDVYQYSFLKNVVLRILDEGIAASSVVGNRSSSHIALTTPERSLIKRLSDDSQQEVRANPHVLRSADGLSELSGFRTLSGDGSVVVFESSATNLLDNPEPSSVRQTYVFDAETGDVQLLFPLSTSAVLDTPRALSDNGSYILFESSRSDLVENDTNNARDLFLLDLESRDVIRINGQLPSSGQSPDVDDGDLSADGRWVVFSTSGNYSELPDQSQPGENVYLLDTQLGEYHLVSRSADGG